MDKHQLDGRLDCAPSHWNENFKIFYLTEKMRSQQDPHFSDVCDRVGRGKITDEDESFLKSRVKKTESEDNNQNFKDGKLSIIVTTNKKREIVNSTKLAELLPNVKEYTCNSVDRVINLPGKAKIPEKLQNNPGNTGNLQTELKLKVGAPVVITTNHTKQKYREDGIVNGARGFVQSIQVSKTDPEKVNIIWVVFNKETIGRLYRFEHAYLRKEYNPGHALATPIFSQRKNFKLKFGNVEYQRTNFALSLAYGLTSHKCQGETLDEVIIDFGADAVNKVKNFICPGSFYVALTRVKMGSKVFLRSFEKSFIKVNKSIEDKVDAMRKFRKYNFKKVYLDERIFENIESEIKGGYLNINGLTDGSHGSYLNSDHNLKYLDILVLAETKLDKSWTTDKLEDILSDWKILRRYDADDGSKHMGLMLLSSKHSNAYKSIQSVTHQKAKREDKLQIQGLTVRFSHGLNVGFIYCRSTPSNSEIKSICRNFKDCNILMGDFNLSHRNEEDCKKLRNLCQSRKVSALNEITRSLSNNQLEYILIDEVLKNFIFVTSYNNFISDHNSVIFRFGLNENQFTAEIKERITFDRDSHMKSKIKLGSSSRIENFEEVNQQNSSFNCSSIHEETTTTSIIQTKIFNRKFDNPDFATCWLNSCLQLILVAMDNDKDNNSFNSELGKELLRLQSIKQNEALDPSNFKDIIVCTEDTRIASRLSRLLMTTKDKTEVNEQTKLIEETRLDLRSGQQCVRDFFLCLNENILDWPDVFSMFAFELTHSSKCVSCQHENMSETTQMYLEMPVPPNDSDLKDYVEDYLNEGSTLGYFCNEGCKKFSEKTLWTTLTSGIRAKFLIIVLTRGIETLDGYHLVTNKITATNDISVR